MEEAKTIVIYIPALNEQETIREVVNSIPTFFDGFGNVKVLVVDDGSSDHTSKEAILGGAAVISHSKNWGVGRAFHSALNFSLREKADVLVSIDADGQFDVSQIHEFVEPIKRGAADFCIGNRFYASKPDQMPLVKYWGNKQISKIISYIAKEKITDASCGYRAYSKDCIYSLNLQGKFTYTHETILELLHKGFKIKQIPVKVYYFKNRTSRIASNLFRYSFKVSLIIFQCLKDYKPLKFFMSIALIIILVALFIGGFVAYHWISTGMITPYKSFGFISLALCGMAVMIITLAFIADMLNRIRDNQEKILFLAKKKYFD